ncbi:hypothetical protein [Protaetiibacter intestinalis]|uniref:Uncharacterized protein n=1 Tax=Protaetiibacter intestinalis TaxID=2419774 RepID=A0A387BJB1_9MICO|nr:hypothetical protein [Protaetiibacter intestinalis]AYF98610.1 hypothetical protein D7I47_10285 [Protaetiibacter intestinalis]
MKWLDLMIDRIHGSDMLPASRLTQAFGPFSVVGSLVNVLVCALFVRIHVRARRGDFDPRAE